MLGKTQTGMRQTNPEPQEVSAFRTIPHPLSWNDQSVSNCILEYKDMHRADGRETTTTTTTTTTPTTPTPPPPPPPTTTTTTATSRKLSLTNLIRMLWGNPIPSQTCVFRRINTKQVSSTSASSTESKNRSTSWSSFPLQLKILGDLGASQSSLGILCYFHLPVLVFPYYIAIFPCISIVSLLPFLLLASKNGSADSAEGLSSSEDNKYDHQMHQKSYPWPGGQPSISTMDLSSSNSYGFLQGTSWAQHSARRRASALGIPEALETDLLDLVYV